MKYFRSILAWLWWVAVAMIPARLGELVAEFSAALGCRQGAECYPNPPFMSPFGRLDFLELEAALLLWPVCLWFVVGRPLWKLIDVVAPGPQQATKGGDSANAP